jgi:hypothetical protein
LVLPTLQAGGNRAVVLLREGSPWRGARAEIYGLAGLGSAVDTADAAGRIEFNGLPRGQHLVRMTGSDDAVAEWSFAVDSLEAEGSPDSAAATAPDTVEVASLLGAFLLEDFEDGDAQNRLAQVLGEGEGWWYLEGDQAIGGGSWTFPAGNSPAEWTPALSEVPAWSGRSLTIYYTLDGMVSGAYVQIGTNLGVARPLDLRSVDSIGLAIQGDGELQLALIPPAGALSGFAVGLDSLAQADPKGMAPVSATASWRHVVLHRSDFVPPVPGVAWEQWTGELASLALFASSGTFVRIDEIQLYGADLPAMIGE